MRIIQFSDTHISHRGGLGHDNAERLAGYLNEVARPDLVINSGDVVIIDPDDEADRAAALRLHQRIEAPLRVIPGNHDVGEGADDPWRGIKVSSERVRAFRQAWGSDRFVVHGEAGCDADGWAFVGINSELCGSGLPEEDEQWAWLEDMAASLAGRPVMLFLHKPLLIDAGSGPTAVWAPSLSFAPPAEPELKFAPGTSGVVEYTIHGQQLEARFLAVPGITGAADARDVPEVRWSMDALDLK
jgi:3',5'-cyclic AMP phosphodiesterase CpdA